MISAEELVKLSFFSGVALLVYWLMLGFIAFVIHKVIGGD